MLEQALGNGTDSTHCSGHNIKPAGHQEAFGQCSQAESLDFEWSYVDQGVGFDNLCESLPSWEVL